MITRPEVTVDKQKQVTDIYLQGKVRLIVVNSEDEMANQDQACHYLLLLVRLIKHG